MTTSGVSTFTQTRDQIITRAGRLIGAFAEGEVPGSAQITDGALALNALIKEWQADGIHVWKETEASVILVPNQTSYVLGPDTTDRVTASFSNLTLTTAAASLSNQLLLNATSGLGVGNVIGIFQMDGSIFWTTIAALISGGVQTAATLPVGAAAGAHVVAYAQSQTIARPLRILDARRYDIASYQEIPLSTISRLDYRDLPNKFSTGLVNSVFYDPQLNDGTLWIWPPVAVNGTIINFTYMRAIDVCAASGNTPDFPEEWINALTWNLAVEMAAEYGAPADRMQLVLKRAAETKDTAAGFDREPESIYAGVNMNQSTR